MYLTIKRHKKKTEYYSVKFPKDVSLAAIGKTLGVSKMTVSLWQKKIPKHRIPELFAIPEASVKK